MLTQKIFLYAYLHISLIILEAINTRNTHFELHDNRYTSDEMYGFYYMFIFSKIILIMDMYYFSGFYFKKTIDTAIQIKVIKLISISIWIYLGHRFGFSPSIIVYICVKALSFVVLSLFQKEESPIAYHLYNLKISLDLRIIKAHLVSKIIEALKSTSVICTILILYFEFSFEFSNEYIFLFYIKTVVLLVDRILYNRIKDKKIFYIISVVIMSITSAIGLSITIYLVVKNGFKQEPIFVFNEIIMASIVLLLLYYHILRWNVNKVVDLEKRSIN